MVCEDMPSIEWFTNNNPYSESEGLFRYIIFPDVKEETITVKIWYSPYCYEKNEDNILHERVFEMTKGGQNEAVQYLKERYQEFLQQMT